MCFEDHSVDPRPTADYETQEHLKIREGRCLAPQAIAAAKGSGPCRNVAAPTVMQEIRVEPLDVTFQGYTYRSEIAFAIGRERAPVVLVFPNYAGKKQFDVDQAVFLAQTGYVGVAVELYKETPEYTYADRNPGRSASAEEVKRHRSAGFGMMNGVKRNLIAFRGLMEATLSAARQHSASHPQLAGGIGYCFGGVCVLECVRGRLDMQAVVSFHGVLQTGLNNIDQDPNFDDRIQEAPKGPYATWCRVLIENGNADVLVPQESAIAFKKEMDDNGIDWQFHDHAKTPHGFALPPGVFSAAYNQAADRRSTLSMLQHFKETWPDFPQYTVARNAAGTLLYPPRARL
mmetsp:Transcript_9209/g.20044  ORF Transcript_9209/g.20044 Transcript_9209/m.20044 type:complete len:345 (-) Transcript_9209:189-1223(-)